MLRLIAVVVALIALNGCGFGRFWPQAEPAPINAVKVIVSATQPTQVVAVIDGVLVDGCKNLGRIHQRRDSNTIVITVPVIHRGEMCTLMAIFFSEQVTLEGAFEPGEYLLLVNDKEQAFLVP